MLTSYQKLLQSRIPANELFEIVISLPEYIERKYQELLVQNNLQDFSEHVVPIGTPVEVRARIDELESEAEIKGHEEFKRDITSMYGVDAQQMVDELFKIMESVNDSPVSTDQTSGTIMEKTIKHHIESPGPANAALELTHKRILAKKVAEDSGMSVEAALAWIMDPNGSDLQIHKKTIECHVGILTTKFPAILAVDYVRAFEAISVILKRNYPLDYSVALQGFADWKKPIETLEADLDENERELQETLQKLSAESGCDKIYMITVCCNEPLSYKLPDGKVKELIAEMQAKGISQTRTSSGLDMWVPAILSMR